jgi:adenine phosphoribosyltransferase
MRSVRDDVTKRMRILADTPYLGATYYDLSPIVADADLFLAVAEQIAAWLSPEVEIVMAPEASGIAFGAAVAAKAQKGFVPLRRKGRLFGDTVTIDVRLPHRRHPETPYVFCPATVVGKHIALIDDIIYSGLTIAALAHGLQTAGVHVASIACVLGFPKVYRANLAWPVRCVVEA